MIIQWNHSSSVSVSIYNETLYLKIYISITFMINIFFYVVYCPTTNEVFHLKIQSYVYTTFSRWKNEFILVNRKRAHRMMMVQEDF